MKVINLLNNIANGEDTPYRVRINNVYYHYDIDDCMYYRDDEDKDEFYTDAMITGFVSLNDNVEIVEYCNKLQVIKDYILTNMGYYSSRLQDAKDINAYVDNLNYIISLIDGE